MEGAARIGWKRLLSEQRHRPLETWGNNTCSYVNPPIPIGKKFYLSLDEQSAHDHADPILDPWRRPKGLRISMLKSNNNNVRNCAVKSSKKAPSKNAVPRPARRRTRVNNKAVSFPAEYKAAVSAAQIPMMSMAPVFSGPARAQTVPVRGRELIQTVTGASSFAPVLYPINAALAQMFAALSPEARRYEKYRFKRLAFEYLNSVSPADPTNAGGNISMAVDFDVLDSAPPTIQLLSQNRTNISFSPYTPVRMELSPADLQRRGWLFTRLGGVPSGADAKTYDLGNLILAFSGTSTNGLGLLYVDYEVELDVPQSIPIEGQKSVASAGLTASALAGTAPTVTGVVNWTASSASTWTCAVAGDYEFEHVLVGTVFVATTNGCGIGGTATPVAKFIGIADAAQTGAVFSYVVRAKVGDTVVPSINSATTVTSSTTRISQYDSSLG